MKSGGKKEKGVSRPRVTKFGFRTRRIRKANSRFFVYIIETKKNWCVFFTNGKHFPRTFL